MYLLKIITAASGLCVKDPHGKTLIKSILPIPYDMTAFYREGKRGRERPTIIAPTCQVEASRSTKRGTTARDPALPCATPDKA